MLVFVITLSSAIICKEVHCFVFVLSFIILMLNGVNAIHQYLDFVFICVTIHTQLVSASLQLGFMAIFYIFKVFVEDVCYGISTEALRVISQHAIY